MGARKKRPLTPIYSEYGVESLELRPISVIGFINSPKFPLPHLLIFPVIIKEGEICGCGSSSVR